MPLKTFKSENKQSQSNSVAKLRLAHDERARIVALSQPESLYVHTYQAPAVDGRGNVIQEEKTKKDGTPYTAPKLEFFGSHLCFGDFDIVEEKGVDVKGCVGCQAAQELQGFFPPKPRYAMDVIRYELKPNSWQLRSPFSVTVIPWEFAYSRFEELIDLAEINGGDLRTVDLLLGPCKNKDFQKFDIKVDPNAQWMLDDDRKKMTAETFNENKTEDLSTVIGKKITRARALEDIERVKERFAQIERGGVSEATQSVDTASAAADALGVLSAPAETHTESVNTETGEVTTKATSELSFEEIMAGI